MPTFPVSSADDVAVLYTAALRAFATGRYPACVELLQCVAVKAPHEAAAYFWLAKASLALGDVAGALESSFCCLELLAAASSVEPGGGGEAVPLRRSIDNGTFSRRDAVELMHQLQMVTRRKRCAGHEEQPFTIAAGSEFRNARGGVDSSRRGSSRAGMGRPAQRQAALRPQSRTERMVAVVAFVVVTLRVLLSWCAFLWRPLAPRGWELLHIGRMRARHVVAVPCWLVALLCAAVAMLAATVTVWLKSADVSYCVAAFCSADTAVTPVATLHWVFVPFLFV